MPMYNYNCDCGHEFEDFNKIVDRETTECEKCGGVAKQGISTPAVQSFNLGVFEHIGPEPIYVKRKSQLKALCRQYECYAKGALN